MSHLKLLQILLCALLCSLGQAQQVSQEQLDTFLNTLAQQDKFMGTLQVSRNGQKIYGTQYGFANLETKVPATENTLYRVGSISKTFTAVLILKAVEEGKLSLSQTLDAFFPSIPNSEKITVAQMLNHHSGIHNFTNGPGFMEWRTQPKTEQEMVQIIAAGGSDFVPGIQAAYSNSNYVLLSYLLQQVYQQPYAVILQEKILDPLHLQHTQFGDATLPEAKKTRSYTYQIGWQPVADTHYTIPMGAGGILMSAPDLVKFIEALFQGKLLSKTSLETMLTQTDGYGMGIFEAELFHKKAYTHDGKIDGFNAFYYYFPEEKTTYALLSNAENYELGQVNQAVLAYTFGEPFDLPTLPTYTVTKEDLAPYLGVYGSTESSLVIKVTHEDNHLLAQPEGQQIYPMDAVAKDQFKHYKSGVTLEFDPSQGSMTMKQGTQNIHFTKR
ncbi:serine hydrolase domain-containing protein [Flagellimonas pelagia]|uniref:Beta-lactamase family protein n=1 Tax=Flagellimonas pelagia TaxID=2306998 RepID=A0A3A1NBQ1_9FLAO|nr:serine hydrolase domain-containing protein [Allomuricauda maritima]RIV41835.1 class A beta-lactamase-related serine hydrolase [Allomuricauda maritima]TXJ90711.1 beta-lactamase family protein [Allomuricauda maritima]